MTKDKARTLAGAALIAGSCIAVLIYLWPFSLAAVVIFGIAYAIAGEVQP